MKKAEYHADEAMFDDGALLADSLIRTFHRAPDGHLASSQRGHVKSVRADHNVAVLYIYTCHKTKEGEDSYELHEHYVYTRKAKTYKTWKKIAHAEVDRLNDNPSEDYVGVYGWATAKVNIRPLRDGDLFLTIDKNGVRGVRLSFSPKAVIRKDCKGKKRGKR